MTYLEFKTENARLNEAVRVASLRLRLYKSGRMGLTPDAEKTPAWRADRAAYMVAHDNAAKFFRTHGKRFKAEIRADRDAARKAHFAAK